MDIQLQELIEKIKKEGIEQANEDADRVKSDAEAKARGIVEAAKKEADSLLAAAKADAEKAQKAGEAALEQAGRNLVLSFKSKIEGLLDKIVARESAKAFDESALKAILPEVLKGWSAGKGTIDVILDESKLASLKDWAQGALSAELAAGVEIKAGKGVGVGFRIAEKDGSAYYDFSADAVTEALAEYLNPQLAALLKSA